MGKQKRPLQLNIKDPSPAYYTRFPGQLPMAFDSTEARLAAENMQYYPPVNFKAMGGGDVSQGVRQFWDELMAQGQALPEERRAQFIEHLKPKPLPDWTPFVYDPALDVDAIGMAKKAQGQLKNPANNSSLEVQGKTARRTEQNVAIANAKTEADRQRYTDLANYYMNDILPYSAKVPAADNFNLGLRNNAYSNMMPLIYNSEGDLVTSRQEVEDMLADYGTSPRAQLGLDGSIPMYDEETGPYTFKNTDPVSRDQTGQLQYGEYLPGGRATAKQTTEDPSLVQEPRPFVVPLPKITEPEMVDETYAYQVSKGSPQKADVIPDGQFYNYQIDPTNPGMVKSRNPWELFTDKIDENLTNGASVSNALGYIQSHVFGGDIQRQQKARDAKDFLTVYGPSNVPLTGAQAFEITALGKSLEQFAADWKAANASGNWTSGGYASWKPYVIPISKGGGRQTVKALIDERTGTGFTIEGDKPRFAISKFRQANNDISRSDFIVNLMNNVKGGIQWAPHTNNGYNSGAAKYSVDKVDKPGSPGEKLKVIKSDQRAPGYWMDLYGHDWTLQTLGKLAINGKGTVNNSATITDGQFLLSDMPAGYNWDWLKDYLGKGSKAAVLDGPMIDRIKKFYSK